MCILCEGRATVKSNYSNMKVCMHFNFKEDAENHMCAGMVPFCPFLCYKNNTLECMCYHEAALEMFGCEAVNDIEKYTVNVTYPGLTPITDPSMSFGS